MTNNEILNLQKELIEQKIAIVETNTSIPETEQLSKLSVLLKEKKKIQDTIEEQDQKDQFSQHLDTQAEEFIIENNIYYVSEFKDKWVETDGMGSRYFRDINTRSNRWPEYFTYDEKNQLFKTIQMKLKEMGRIYSNVGYAFGETDHNTLNLLHKAKEHFLQPKKHAEEVAPLLDVLFHSLGGGKEQNIKHIKDVTYHKWKSPDNYTLPALVMTGEGGIGKNRFVEDFCATLFGSSDLVSSSGDLNSNFNRAFEGKAVVMIDESDQRTGSQNQNKLKQIVGNKTITINEKYLPAFEITNTALYILTSNDEEGRSSVLLGGDASDRRYSIMHIKKNAGNTLYDVIARRIFKEEFDHDIDHIQNAKLKERVHQYWENESYVLKDKDALENWLYHYAKEASDTAPMALHGEDHAKVIKGQKTDQDKFLDLVFESPAFVFIQRSELFKWWSEYAGRYAGRKAIFFEGLDRHIHKNERVDITKHNCLRHKQSNRMNVDVVYNKGRYTPANLPNKSFAHLVDVLGNFGYVEPEDYASFDAPKTDSLYDNVTPITARQKVLDAMVAKGLAVPR